jgi:hypothetical protein
MPEVTLELVQARQAELAQLIEQLKRGPAVKGSQISLPAIDIDLAPGEHYAGTVLDEQGHVKHHLVLMAAKPDGELAWQAAMDWAASVGGALPTRQEQALLYANCKPHLKPDYWHWSCETDGSSYAWGCNFYNGGQTNNDRSAEGCAVAVRRFKA